MMALLVVMIIMIIMMVLVIIVIELISLELDRILPLSLVVLAVPTVGHTPDLPTASQMMHSQHRVTLFNVTHKIANHVNRRIIKSTPVILNQKLNSIQRLNILNDMQRLNDLNNRSRLNRDNLSLG